MSNSSSSSMTSSTTSNESASRSSVNDASNVTKDSSTSSCSTIISFTRSNTSATYVTSLQNNAINNKDMLITSPCHHQYEWFDRLNRLHHQTQEIERLWPHLQDHRVWLKESSLTFARVAPLLMHPSYLLK